MLPADFIKRIKNYAVLSFLLPLIAINSCLLIYKYIGDNPFKLVKALVNEYGDRSPEKIMCVPEETIESFMEQAKT